jgi:hypothetical protein
MARDDMTPGEFGKMVGSKKPTGDSDYGTRLRSAEASHKSQWSDPQYAGKVLGGLHDAYHASGGPANLNGSWHDRVSKAAQNIAGMHARATGQATSNVLQAHGFHPVTGQSMHAAPSSPTHAFVPGTSMAVSKI